MTPAENFPAFQCYKEVIGATDEQLCAILMNHCCEPTVAMYEDAMTQAIIRWLFAMTGCPWVRGYEDGQRVDESLKLQGHEQDGQYGTVWMLRSEPSNQTPMRLESDIEVNGELQQDRCESYEQLTRFEFQLDVYRDKGRAITQEETPYDALGRAGSSIDVLHQASLRSFHPLMRRALTDYGLQVGGRPITEIRNLPQPLVTETFENRANANLVVYGCLKSSIRLPSFDPGTTEIEFCPETSPDVND